MQQYLPIRQVLPGRCRFDRQATFDFDLDLLAFQVVSAISFCIRNVLAGTMNCTVTAIYHYP